MFPLILLVSLGLGFGYFATQNTQHITISLANYVIPSVPLYIIIGVTLLIGFAISWIISLSDMLSTTFRMRGKESTIKNAKKTIHDLTKQINELEIENATLKGKLENGPVDDESL